MFARDAAQCAAARAVQTDPDNGLLALVKARPRIDDPLTGKDQVLFQQRRRITRLDKVRMFCCSAFFCIAARASGASAPVSEMPLSASAFDICHCNSLMSLESAARAFSAESLFVKGITIC